jgi:hypothetical protein
MYIVYVYNVSVMTNQVIDLYQDSSGFFTYISYN